MTSKFLGSAVILVLFLYISLTVVALEDPNIDAYDDDIKDGKMSLPECKQATMHVHMLENQICRRFTLPRCMLSSM
ncbi:transmembrane protein, putative [Medicago truncatula]|uniref:Transmembrane protein, putative n=1 Tax=Medicago truncatula TaxID=3880 RepID=G7L8R5_MEDTR|nr:transmembrane protein, putative [Medicago truncatula]